LLARLPARTRHLIALLAVAAPGCGGSEPDRGACELPPPEFAEGAVRGSLETTATGPVSVGVAARDTSATVVGFCLPGSRFPDPAPSLDDGGRRLYPIGGELQQTSQGWRNYYVYEASRDPRVAVRRGGRVIARISFPQGSGRSCGLRAARPFRVVACGSIVVVEWSSPFNFDAERLELLDIEARETDREGTPLNLYDMGYRNGPDGLLVRFGIRPARSGRVHLRANFAYVQTGDRVEEKLLHEQASFELAAG
jgi:hypothetical protein